MADKEKKPLKGGKGGGPDGQGGDEELDKEEEEGCCSKFGSCIVAVTAAIYRVTVVICRATRDCLAFFWYPCKERCNNCLDDCDRKMNPWKDPSYSHV